MGATVTPVRKDERAEVPRRCSGWQHRRMGKRLSGKVVLVTGSTRGIGRAIATRCAAEGAAVVVTGRTETTGHAVQEEIRAAGGEATYVRADFAQEDDIEHAIRTTIQK